MAAKLWKLSIGSTCGVWDRVSPAPTSGVMWPDSLRKLPVGVSIIEDAIDDVDEN